MAARYAIGRQGGIVHIVHAVKPIAKDWVKTTFKCSRGQGLINAIHLDEVGNRTPCRRCMDAQDDTDEQRVYVARVGDLIKVGCSNQVARRVTQDFKGEVIAWVPGSYDKERVVLDRIETAPIRGREWFPAEAEEHILTILMAVA